MSTAAVRTRISRHVRSAHPALRPTAGAEILPPRVGSHETVVHLACEYLPYAQTGGLAEAVRGIAAEQARSGRRAVVFIPLHRCVRERVPDIEPAGDPFEVLLGERMEVARIYRDPATGPGRPEVFFVENEGFFDRPAIYGEGGDYLDNHLRFGLFCRAALHWMREVVHEPVLLHPHDWHTALAPVFLRHLLAGDAFYDQVATILTVHNAGFQGHYGSQALDELGLGGDAVPWGQAESHGGVNLLKLGVHSTDVVTTVSPTHAGELLTPMGGFGLHDVFGGLEDRFVGILNSIDYSVWDPETDPEIEGNYGPSDLSGKSVSKGALQRALGLDEDPDVPTFAMAARLVEQKGLDLILESGVLARPDAQWIFLGEGEPRYQEALKGAADANPGAVACRFQFTEAMERRIIAGADCLLMPSLYEPCGLTQMRAQRYGVLPVVRKVGGLADTVDDGVTGFVFDTYEPQAFESAIERAVESYRDRSGWERMMRTAMSRDFSFRRCADEYSEAYALAIRVRREAGPGS